MLLLQNNDSDKATPSFSGKRPHYHFCLSRSLLHRFSFISLRLQSSLLFPYCLHNLNMITTLHPLLAATLRALTSLTPPMDCSSSVTLISSLQSSSVQSSAAAATSSSRSRHYRQRARYGSSSSSSTPPKRLYCCFITSHQSASASLSSEIF